MISFLKENRIETQTIPDDRIDHDGNRYHRCKSNGGPAGILRQ